MITNLSVVYKDILFCRFFSALNERTEDGRKMGGKGGRMFLGRPSFLGGPTQLPGGAAFGGGTQKFIENLAQLIQNGHMSLTFGGWETGTIT